MKHSRGVVVVMGLALFALTVGCMAQAEDAATERQGLLDGCSRDSDCEDGEPCTQNLCAIGVCAPALPVLGCCYEGACTAPDARDAVAPLVELPPSGCSQHDDCEDGHPCTQNLCVAGECAALPVLGCCLDGECSAGTGGSAGSGGSGSGAEAGASAGGGPSREPTSAGAAATDAGGATVVAGAGASSGGSSAEGASKATDAGSRAMAPGEGAVSPPVDDDYQLQGGSCALESDPGTSPYVALLGLVVVAARRARGRRASGTAPLRHS
ncbi:MAG: hypothetical protein EOO73_01590 [Myxococcales bacterium]|nr:MAG: hypothetical protein EOO73_01590 [Myxococcales bacterium]